MRRLRFATLTVEPLEWHLLPWAFRNADNWSFRWLCFRLVIAWVNAPDDHPARTLL